MHTSTPPPTPPPGSPPRSPGELRFHVGDSEVTTAHGELLPRLADEPAAGRDAGLGRKPEIAADSPKRAREDIEHRFGELEASGVGSAETNREVAERLEREIAAARVELKASNAGCERLEGVLVALRQGAVGLYQRLRPFGHLLEGEGALPTAAMLPGAVPPSAVASAGGAGPEAPTIDSIDAIHLSEIMLSKMVEIISGGEHGAGTSGIMNLHDSSGPTADDLDDDESTAEDSLPHPTNNIRVRSEAQQKELDRKINEKSGSFFITAGGDDDEEDRAEEAKDDEDEGEDGVGLAVGLSDAQVAEALDDMVPSRTFLKLSSSRQHQEQIRRNEQDARKKRMLERIEMAEGAERAQMSSRAARKKAQTEANNRLSKMVKQGQPPPLSKTKDSAIERSMMFLKQVPELL